MFDRHRSRRATQEDCLNSLAPWEAKKWLISLLLLLNVVQRLRFRRHNFEIISFFGF